MLLCLLFYNINFWDVFKWEHGCCQEIVQAESIGRFCSVTGDWECKKWWLMQIGPQPRVEMLAEGRRRSRTDNGGSREFRSLIVLTIPDIQRCRKIMEGTSNCEWKPAHIGLYLKATPKVIKATPKDIETVFFFFSTVIRAWISDLFFRDTNILYNLGFFVSEILKDLTLCFSHCHNEKLWKPASFTSIYCFLST